MLHVASTTQQAAAQLKDFFAPLSHFPLLRCANNSAANHYLMPDRGNVIQWCTRQCAASAGD